MRFVYFVLCLAILFVMCDENNNGIVGSPDHDVRIDQSKTLGVIADGVSTLDVKVVVTSLSGLPAGDQQVYFSSTCGEITQIVTTDAKGVAIAELQSVASKQDLFCTVTATVLDSTSRLYKTTPLLLELALDAGDENTLCLKKANTVQENTVSADVIFRGISINLTLSDSLISADGISATDLNVHLYETTNKQPVAHKQLTATCFKGSVNGSLYTNDQGVAELQIVSAKQEVMDSVFVSVGNTLSKSIGLRYIFPKLTIHAKENIILADGRSSTDITATLLTIKNTPIQGANIYFSASAGVIGEKAVSDADGKATVSLVSDDQENANVVVKAVFSQLVDSLAVSFALQGEGDLQISATTDKVLRDGQSTVAFQVNLGSGENAAANEKIQLSAGLGKVPASVTTNSQGIADFVYTPDAGFENATTMIVALWNGKQVVFDMSLIGIDIYAKVLQDSLPADGSTETTVQVHLKEAVTGVPIVGYPVSFGVQQGRIVRSAITNEQGVISQVYTAGDVAGKTELTVFVGQLAVTRSVYLVDIYPSQIQIDTETNYIWVRETGEIEQTSISAKIVGISGEPINKVYHVVFRIVQGPGGGEILQAPSGFESNEITVTSNRGLAFVKLRSGTRSGAVQIAAEIQSMPQIRAQTSQIVIRSGPPYMWISPLDHNNVIQHGTLIVEPGKHNVVFANPVQPISVSAIFTDKYNNPVEQGTAVYFTTTGGLVSSDAVTNEMGQATVTLQNANPFPMLHTNDTHQLTATNFPDPNDQSRLINVVIPDFESGQILNSINDMGMNDGVATILAVTNGRDQFNQNIKVYVYNHVVYSVGLYRFKMWADSYTLQPGEATNIYIEVFDHNGNPVAAGSSLKASTDKGKITVESLMSSQESYGWGSTFFTTALVNNEESSETGTETAIVEIELDSPNGDAVLTQSFTLIVPKTEE